MGGTKRAKQTGGKRQTYGIGNDGSDTSGEIKLSNVFRGEDRD